MMLGAHVGIPEQQKNEKRHGSRHNPICHYTRCVVAKIRNNQESPKQFLIISE